MHKVNMENLVLEPNAFSVRTWQEVCVKLVSKISTFFYLGYNFYLGYKDR